MCLYFLAARILLQLTVPGICKSVLVAKSAFICTENHVIMRCGAGWGSFFRWLLLLYFFICITVFTCPILPQMNKELEKDKK